MSYVATRLTLFAIISAIETDLRNIIVSELCDQATSEDILGGDLWITANDRLKKDTDALTEAPSLNAILCYVDFGDLYQILNRYKRVLSPSIREFMSANTARFEQIVSVRNRVAHTRPLLFDDFPKVWDIAEELYDKYSRLLQEFVSSFNRIRSDPSYVLSLKIPEYNHYNQCAHNLPTPDFDETGFIGRTDIVNLVVKHCKGPYPVITIVGEGGIGKTALAIKVAYDIMDADDNPFEAVIWTSAKTQQLTVGHIVEIDTAIRTSLGIFQSVADELSGYDTKDPLGEILNYMKEFRILLILDNLETVLDARISEFLTNIPYGTKILITSRIGLGAYEVPLKLDPLDVNESVQLVRALARVRGVSNLVKMSNKRLSKYCMKMKNNPGYIKWFISAIQAGQRPEDVLDNPEIFLEFCMSNVYKYLSEESKKLLKSMQAVPGRHSQAELGFLNSDISAVDLQRAIQQLLTTNMVNMSSLERGSTFESTYDISELARAYLDISHPLDALEILFYSKRRNQLISASDAFAAKKIKNLYSPRTIVTRSKRDFVVAKELFDVVKAVLDPIGRKNLERAKIRIEEARKLSPDYYEVRRVEAFVHTAMNNYTAARASYDAALELEPGSSPLHYWYGNFLLRYLDDTEGSLNELEKANSIDPNAHQIRIELARVNLYLKNFKKARDLIDSLLKQVELLDAEKRRIYDLNLQYFARFADDLADQHRNIEATEYCETMLKEFEKCPPVLRDDNMIFHIKKAAYTIKRCIRYLDNYPDYKERAQDVYNWIEHL